MKSVVEWNRIHIRNIDIFLGGDPSRGEGFHLQTGGQKMEIVLYVFGAEGAAKNF